MSDKSSSSSAILNIVWIPRRIEYESMPIRRLGAQCIDSSACFIRVNVLVLMLVLMLISSCEPGFSLSKENVLRRRQRRG
jgi:hypothetical protein